MALPMKASDSEQKDAWHQDGMKDGNDENDEEDEEPVSGMIPEGHLPMYLADAFAELYQEDGLVVMGKGLGCLMLLATFVRFYADTRDGHLAVLQEEQQEQEEQEKQQSTLVGGNQHHKSVSSCQQTKPRHQRPPLVLVLSLHENERHALLQILHSWSTPNSMMPTLITNEAGQGKDRQALYARGGTLVITSRILVTDLLTHTVSANQIDGLLVYHAEQVTETSTEAFILRIFHSQRQPQCSGFVKAFSEAADQFHSDFGKVDKIRKALRVRNLYLYPRFQEAVRNELEMVQPPVIVTELHQPLSPLQREIQHCLAAAIQACLRHLHEATAGKLQLSSLSSQDSKENKDDTKNKDNPHVTKDDLLIISSVENCVTSYFDRAISRQLEPDWHKLSPSTKQLVQDLRTLRTLFQSLLQYDCISFWKLLQNIKTMSASSRHPSLWLLGPAADRLFRKAKERVYQIVHEQPATRTAASATEPHQDQQPHTMPATTVGSKLVAVLEENPKWKLLRSVLDEIQAEYNSEEKQEYDEEDMVEGPSSVLVVVKDDRTVDTLKAYLTGGKKKTLAWTWLRFLEQQNDRSRAILGSTGSSSTAPTNGMAALSEERRLLLEEESRVRRLLFGTDAKSSNKAQESKQQTGKKKKSSKTQNPNKRRKLNEVPAYLKKRRRVAAEKGRGKSMHQSKDDLEREAILDDAMEELEHDLGQNIPNDNSTINNDDEELGENSSDEEETKKPSVRRGVEERLEQLQQQDEEMNRAMFQVSNPTELRVVLKSLTSIETGEHTSLMLLEDIQPTHVVFYDVDVAFIRSVEIYAAVRRPTAKPLKSYFLVFEQSAEEKNFKKVLEREQNSFERLIHHKMVMPPPMLQDTTQSQEIQESLGSAVSTYMNGTLPLAFDSRKGQGKERKPVPRNIAVDVREFRAALPSILHQGGMRLAPVTLTVGDYVLSKVHCIERKSISDLYGSFASGRLYTQAEAMCKHYEVPCLLIEFDPNKSFCLQNPNELGLDIKQDSICTKMAVLCMHFPKLRLIWSRSPHETLKIFQDLKRSHEEVDVDKAVEVGRSESLEALFQGPNMGTEGQEEEDDDDAVNEAARDMLLRLPGITIPAARRIMEQVDSLKELAELPRDKLREIAGPVVGQKLFTFFRQQQQV